VRASAGKRASRPERDGRWLFLGRGRAGGRHGGDEVAAALGLGEDGVAEPEAERLLEAQRQLDALQAAQSQVAVEAVIGRRAAPRGQGPQLRGERGHDIEHPGLDVAGGRRTRVPRIRPGRAGLRSDRRHHTR
jgi:hypothetical protein